MKKLLLPLLIIIVLSSSCSKWGWVTLQYPNPPQLLLSDDIKTIAIVNRSLVKQDDKDKTMIETVASAEVAGSDKLASDECIKAVFDRMNGWSDISIIIPEKTRLYGTGTRETPELLSWDTVRAICEVNKTDVLLVLENFDSNSDFVVQTVTNQVGAVITGQNQPVVPRQIRMNVISFWRLYDPKDKKIIDQYQTKTFILFDNPDGLVIPPPEALPQTAYAAGVEYISRFLPSYYVVRRDMYKRGKADVKQQFLRAFRHAETADWTGAMEIWRPLTNHPKRKVAGRACLNMAVACEVKGNFQGAYDWANKAYVDYRDKTARYYVNKLKYRMSLE
ncbi:MAG: DUF6340 family protein [Bacteroidales bacterium]|jgi:hypothetical protein|nr:DUF6340 family protein [Bacteroidales bacterium]